MIGGMVGNNSSGTTSIQYGVTRDKVLEMQVLLSDGSEVTFGELSQKEFSLKCKQQNLEGNIYRFLQNTLGKQEVQAAILSNFPKPQIHRRNTGYAIDVLLDMQPFSEEGPAFNMCKLLAGSEGTLAFTTGLPYNLMNYHPYIV